MANDKAIYVQKSLSLDGEGKPITVIAI